MNREFSARAWTPRTLFRAFVLLIACAAPRAAAQQIPPIETGPPVTSAVWTPGAQPRLELRDAANGTILLDDRGYPFFSTPAPGLATTLDFQQQPSGGDLIYTFTNTTNAALPLPILSVSTVALGSQIDYMDVREGVEPVAIDFNTYSGWAYEYPTYLYSPLFVLRNSQYSMGISIHYPILEYAHHVKLNLAKLGGVYLNGEGGAGYGARFSLSTTGPEYWQQVQYPASIPAGATRVYVISVRVAKNAADWLYTLVPYRNYFRSMYGGVTYQREVTPIWGVLASDPSMCNASNPLGWLPEWRQDLNGWDDMASVLKGPQTNGWHGIMIWLPGGCYWKNSQLNFPVTPASTWLNTPTLSTIFDPANGMPSVTAVGKDLGFWWGRSCQTAPTWDPPAIEDFDPDNPAHYNRQLRELDLMAAAGATTIGLDTFDPANMPFFKQYRWLLTMRMRYPHIKFITEPTNCDVMNTLAGNFISAWEFNKIPTTIEECYTVRNPNYLADFLVPGHEFWAGMRYLEMMKYLGVTPTQQMVIADMQRYASYGYRPCFLVLRTWWGLSIPNGVANAAKSWETSIPADLRVSDVPAPFGPVAPGSSRVGVSTGSRPQKNGPNSVAGSRPDRLQTPPVPAGPGKWMIASHATPPELREVAVTHRPDGAARPTTADALRALNTIRKERGLAPIADPDSPEPGSEGVQTFTNPKPAPPGKPPVVIPKAPKKDG